MFAAGWQTRVWPEIKNPRALMKFAEEKVRVRERYKSENRKLDFAFLPPNEWPAAISELKPQFVLVEPGYLLVALTRNADNLQAIAVIADMAAFKKDEGSWSVEATADARIKRVLSKATGDAAEPISGQNGTRPSK